MNPEKNIENETVKKAELDALVQGLEKYGAHIETETRMVGAYVIQFKFESATTTIRIVLNDYSGSDVAITNMTTLPEKETSNGFGTQVIDSLKKWAEENGLHEIRATQVEDPKSANFWQKNGFVKREGENKTEDFIYRN